MARMTRVLLGAAMMMSVQGAQAQTATAPVQPVATATSAATLRTGTEVPLRLSEELTTKGKKLRVGQRFHLEVAEPVMVQGVTVIPAGSPAIGRSPRSPTRACGASRGIWARGCSTPRSTAGRSA